MNTAKYSIQSLSTNKNEFFQYLKENDGHKFL